jgi:hypothetical protein
MNSRRVVVPLLCLLPLFAMMSVLGTLRTHTTQAAPNSTQTVTTLADNGAGSLRQAIADASPGDTIDFSVSGTIVLADQLVIDKDLTINGGGVITISGNNTTSIFDVTSGNVTFDGLIIADGNGTTTTCSNSCSGGIALKFSNIAITVTNSTFVNNTSGSAYFGGGIDNFHGVVTVINSTFSGNSSGNGGGIHNNGFLLVSRSTFLGNSSTYGSGISNEYILEVNDSTFFDNSAYNGGAITNYGVMTITNSTFSGNSALYYGGSIYHASPDGVTSINSSTISDNTATTGGGIFSVGPMVIRNSIIANSISGGDCRSIASQTAIANHMLVEDDGSNACGLVDGMNGNIIGQDPQLNPLANNGGTTLTHALQLNSPAVDTGADCGTTDQRGVTRPQGTGCDIGAYEMVFIDFTDFVFLPVVVK